MKNKNCEKNYEKELVQLNDVIIIFQKMWNAFI